ncbi:tRNA lysidine(34) synthetase TilS [Vallitalea pronyensis]|uniref:tRNA(Ile)-lysidine synthase n=1 Tax=Vallitalea pronyensis TaxID=1348613 RepID=A0A8J8MG30_9FIRM|nr:tRNA lysidine(34) synthetase TilS [Vallitalea pronyensis]QUI20821.1 tRNA lysidine(34) synthetase TilS [Vallitalea pronyensis]
MMVEKVLSTIKKWDMVHEGDTVIIGVSGGMDSMCLLHIFDQLKDQLGISICVVHVHHGIRADAGEDVTLVEKTCEHLAIPCHVSYFDVKKLAKSYKLSLEEMGRKIRYDVFEQQRLRVKNGKIAIGHHINDQAETVIMHLMRGTGLKGIGGIPPVRDFIIRPFIDCTREEIEHYCHEHQIAYRDDYTNALNVYTRNKIRHTVIPYVEEQFNKNFVQHMVNTAHIARSEDDYIHGIVLEKMEQVITRKDNSYTIDLDAFNALNLVIRRRIIRQVLHQLGSLKNIEYKHIEQILQLAHKEVSKKIQLPKGIVAKKAYSSIIMSVLGENKTKAFEKDVHLNTKTYIEALDSYVEVRLLEAQKDNIPKNLYTKWFDYDKIKYNLKVRNRRQGDAIVIRGIDGQKKLKKYFIDAKIPREERDKIPLLVDGSQIIWIIGHRISEHYKVTASTKKILEVKYYLEEDYQDA